MRRLAGIDLNGWRDLALRDWLEAPGEADDEGRHILSGGIGGVVVGTRHGGRKLLGGVQALLAPHGRGPGWGEIGQAPRLRVRDILADPASHPDALAAAFAGLANLRRAVAVAAIADRPDSDEAFREELLKALARLRPRARLLVWRPVLAVLHALAEGVPDLSGVESFGVLSHDAQGFVAQTLRLRRAGTVVAPERRRTGQAFASPWGLAALRARALERLRDGWPDAERFDPVESSSLADRLALGERPDAEPLRARNGDWILCTPPAALAPPEAPLPEGLAAALGGSDAVLVETPTEGALREALVNALQRALSRPFALLPPEAIARGAFVAARRHDRGEPIHYDFLPQISTIVVRQREAVSHDLIPPDALLPAGQVYRSPRPAVLGALAGTRTLKLYLRKETDPRPRLATIELPAPLGDGARVEVHVQQAPAAGRARLTLVSPAFPAPIRVDWDKAAICPEAWEELVAAQRPSLPTVPARLVLPCALAGWMGDGRRKGLLEVLRAARHSAAPDWRRLADMLSARTDGTYAISSDGELPAGLPVEAPALLAWAEEAAQDALRVQLRSGRGDNHPLRFLTWTFRRCPEWVVGEMLAALRAGYRAHPFCQNPSARTLLLQGIGRTAVSDRQQRAALDLLLATPPQDWNKDHMACAAFLLSRTDSAPRLLDRRAVEAIAQVAETRILAAVGRDFTARYAYAPFLLVGLLRWRLHEPRALVAGGDEVADRLLAATRALAVDLEGRARADTRLARFRRLLLQVCGELRGEGTNPHLLVDLEHLASGS